MPDAPHSPQLQRFFDELKELQAVFVLGQRSLPFLEELFDFVQDITLLMEEVDDAIRSQTGDMPRATSQLKSVSEATELATNEILDLADAALAKLKAQETALESKEAFLDDLAGTDERLRALLQEELAGERPALMDEVEALLDEKQTLREQSSAELETVREALAAIRGKVNHIMMSLQVQDITAQQIASVNHLIESVRERMGSLLSRIGSQEQSGGAAASDEATTFDEHARYNHAPDRQRMADDLVAELSGAPEGAQGDGTASVEAPAPPSEPEESSHTAASQDEIDALFGGGQDASAKEAPAKEAPAKGGGGGEAASQADIDELFG